MQTRQDSISFPIRKTRASRKSYKEPSLKGTRECVTAEKVQAKPRKSSKKSEVSTQECSPTEVVSQSGSSEVLSSRLRLSRKVELSSNGDVSTESGASDDVCYSPRKPARRRKQLVEDSPARHTRSTPTKHTYSINEGSATPTKVTLSSSDKKSILTPRKRLMVSLPQLPDEDKENSSDPSPSKKSPHNAPLSPVKIESPNCSKNGLAGLQTPKKSPLISSSIANISKGVYDSPSKNAVKRLNLGSPVKSPLKCLNFGSPRRSPRKLRQENVLSPRRSPRKLPQSPLRFSSPSSLMSRISLDSPDSRRNVDAISLFKPDVTAYRALRQTLNTAAPTVLVCREKQVGEMHDFLTTHLQQGKPGSLYVSGAPGTGKTASLNSIIDTLQVKKLKRVFLNCMTLKTSAAIYKAIITGLGFKIHGTDRENRNAIEKAICSSKQTILLMLDEVDQLDSKNQEVLYTIFEWPALAGSRLVLVGIANSLDLTDRILPRLQARPTFKPRLLHFPPYSKVEIISIINQRINQAGLGDVQVIRASAIQLLAGKVASVAGDARKALDVCRRAVELCEGQARRQAVLLPINGSPKKSFKMVEIPQVLSIFNEVYGSRVVTAVTDAPESFPLQQKVLICCLLLILKHARSKDITLGKFHDVYRRVCKKRQLPGMDQSEFLSLCTLLESRGMLQVKQAKEIRSSKVLLRLNAEEAGQTLGDRNLLASILEDKEILGKLCKNK